MSFTMRKRRGIGNVITTLIILIASVVLGAGVIFFGGSLFQINTQNEEIRISNTHIWVSQNTTSSVAAFVVQNTGAKAVAVNEVTVRGMSVPQSSWYYNSSPTVATVTNIQRDLNADFNLGGIDVDGAPGDEPFTQATGPVTLVQGQAAIFYVANPAGIDSIDSGLGFTITVEAGRASASMASVDVS
jgi:hypothetical protein